MSRLIIPCLLFTLTVILSACQQVPSGNTGSLRKDANNMAFLYSPAENSLHPEGVVWHTGDSISTLYVALSTSDLLFNQANAKGEFLASLKLRFDLFRINRQENSRQLADSGSFVYNLRKDKLRGYFATSIVFRCVKGQEYMLRLFVYDQLRKKSMQSFIRVDKISPYTSQNYYVFTGSGQVPLYKKWLDTITPVSIRYNRPGFDSLYIHYFKDKIPLPRPLFSTEAEQSIYIQPDSTWILPLSDSSRYLLRYTGLYQFRVDPKQLDGYSLYVAGNNYPQIKDPQDLIEPLAYLTSTTEQAQLESNENKKLALDNFWIQAAGNMQVARELIRIYYNRVYYANYYFTADRPGWKTDRGMIFVVYGPPKTLHKTDNAEEWIYYPSPGRTITFTFRYTPNPHSYNSFELLRGLEPAPHWREAVDSWRSGRVYMLD